jgi:hypothetical protein
VLPLLATLAAFISCGGRVSLGGTASDAGADAIDAGRILAPGSSPKPGPDGTCGGACGAPGAIKAFHSIAELDAITGPWVLCSGELGPAGSTGIQLVVKEKRASFLVSGAAHGHFSFGNGPSYERQIEAVDATPSEGPGERAFQIKIYEADLASSASYVVRYSACSRKLELEDAISGAKAEYVTFPSDQLPSPHCMLDGTWDTVGSTDPPAQLQFLFETDTFAGGPAGVTLPDGKTFGGEAHNGSDPKLSLYSSWGMGCGQAATFQLTYDESCFDLTLLVLTDACDGEPRRYLYDGAKLRRR